MTYPKALLNKQTIYAIKGLADYELAGSRVVVKPPPVVSARSLTIFDRLERFERCFNDHQGYI